MRWLKAQPAIKKVLDALDSIDFQFGYQPETEEFRTYRYQNSWEVDGKIEWYKRGKS